MLYLLLNTTTLGVISARVGSIAFALLVTWQLNRWLTFGPSSRHVAVEGARYGGIGMATSVVNFVVYSAVLWAAPGLTVFVALVIGSLAALAFSFFGYSRLVFDR
jgi:putative flippase GtrA